MCANPIGKLVECIRPFTKVARYWAHIKEQLRMQKTVLSGGIKGNINKVSLKPAKEKNKEQTNIEIKTWQYIVLFSGS